MAFTNKVYKPINYRACYFANLMWMLKGQIGAYAQPCPKKGQIGA